MSILESFLAGKEARRVADAAEQINAMQQFIGQNGQAIMGGDQNALGQLAGFGQQGLQMAMGIQGDVQQRERQTKMDALAMEDRAYGRERDKVQDSRADQKWEMELAEYKKSITAEQAAAEAAQIEDAVKMGLMAKTPEEWDALAEQAGAPELVGKFDQRDDIARKFMSIADVLKQTNPDGPEWRTATPEEAAANGAVAGQINTKTGKFDAQNPPQGMVITQGPDGFSLEQGPGVGSGGGKKTEGNLASEGYLGRMKGAEKVFEELAEAGTTSIGLIDKQTVGTDFEPYKLSVPEQRLLQAQRDWVRAKLRKESGAVIGPEEMAEEIRTYFPQPGEGSEIAKQKKESRRMAEEQLRITAALPAEAAGSGSPPETPAPAGSVNFEDAWSKY